MASKASVLTVAAVLATGVLAYAVYFDYKRRNDIDFRRKLKKDKKRVTKSAQQSQPVEEPSTAVNADMLREALRAIKSEAPVPIEEREPYFMSQVGMGEQLASQGPAYYLPAAIAFYRALRIYPAPAELIGIYDKTVHPPVFKLVMELTNMDVSSTSSPATQPSQIIIDDSLDSDTSPVTDKVRGYYNYFPPKSMGVSIVPQPSKSMAGARLTVIVNQDVSAGETIYKEWPIVAALDQDVQVAGTHCTHCFRVIQSGMSIQSEESSSVLPSAYCSKSCLVSSKSQSQSILFTLENPLPPVLVAGPTSPEMEEQRKAAQTAFVESLESDSRNVPMLMARFIARQVVHETQKLVSAAMPSAQGPAGEVNDYTDTEPRGEYTLADHTERFRFVAVTPPEEDLKLLSTLLQTTLPGLEEFTTAERHADMVGKILYNSYGVCFGGGRDNRPLPTCRPEDVERTRTPYGTQRQIGSALYTLSSYLTHSCEPSARVSFSAGTTELHVIANRDLKKGDAVTVAFVDVKQHPDEPVAECRRRRRIELARGWKFACGCDRCAEELAASTQAGAEGEVQLEQEEGVPAQDEAKVDTAVRNYEENLPRAHSPVHEDLPDLEPQPQPDGTLVPSDSEVPASVEQDVILPSRTEGITPVEQPVVA